MRTAYLAPKGTYSQLAKDRYDPGSIDVPCHSFPDVFKAVGNDDADIGIVPAMNYKTMREIELTHHCLVENTGKIKVVDAFIMPIEHSIGVLPGTKEISRIISKREALEQCIDYIRANHPNAEILTEAASTADAIRRAAEDKIVGIAAIGRRDTLIHYGLEIVKEDIVPGNKSLFYVVSKGNPKSTGNDVTPVVIYSGNTNDLHWILETIERAYGINLSSMHISGNKYALRLRADMNGYFEDKHITECVSALERKVKSVHILGTHPSL